MSWRQKDWIRHLSTTLCIVVLAYLLSLLLVQPLALSTATLLSASDRSDFSITDYYNTVANGRKVRMLDQDIAIINIDNADRQDIASLLRIVNLCNPRAIGLDVIFSKEREGDQPLLEAVNQAKHLVLAGTVRQQGDTALFERGRGSYFASAMPQHAVGAVNLPAKYEKSVIRKFPILFDVVDEAEPMPSFVTALVREVDRAKYDKLVSRGNATQYINYPSVEFPVYEPEELNDRAEELEDKILLIGAMTERGDTHVTPIQSHMSGIEIHAHALHTIINDKFIDTLPDWANWSIGFLLAFIIVYMSQIMPIRYKGVLLRVIQFCLLFVIIPVGYYFFVNYNISIDFTYAFLMVSFSFFAADLWTGMLGLADKSKSGAQYVKSRLRALSVGGSRLSVILMVLLSSAFAAQAQYTLYKSVGDVSIERQGKPLDVVKGMKLSSQDVINLGSDGEVEILNSVDSRIYTSVKPGRYTVLRITIDAEAHAKDNSNAFKGLGVKRGAKKTEVYEDEGVVSRALVVYDPENQNMEVDCRKMGISLLSRLGADANQQADSALLKLKVDNPAADALSFEFYNEFEFPVYFNVLKIKDAEAGAMDISELGQPIGCYVVQPRQSLMRGQMDNLPQGERHVLVMTHHYFDIDKLLLNIDELKSSPVALPAAPSQQELPVYVVELGKN